jgi:branched-chain amino acid transport system permease protein
VGALQSSVIPGIAHWTFSAVPVLVTVIGGPYAFLGPTVGAFVYEYLRWYIDQYPALAARWQLVFGIILLVVVVFFENGVAGGLQSLWSRIRSGLASRETATSSD